MKKRPKQQATTKRTIVPKFATEAEEAEWSYKNRKAHSQEFLEAARSGEVEVLTKEKLLARIEASKQKAAAPMITLRLPADNLEKGLPYQIYIKSLLHQALAGVNGKPGRGCAAFSPAWLFALPCVKLISNRL
jgi:predicted DNA binding CopG/RHH family protein